MYIPHGLGVSKVNMLSARVYDWLQTWPGNQFGHSIPGLIYANSPRFPGPHRSAQMSLHFGWFSKLMTLHQLKVFAVIPCRPPSPTPMRCIPILLLSGLCFSLCSHFVSFSSLPLSLSASSTLRSRYLAQLYLSSVCAANFPQWGSLGFSRRGKMSVRKCCDTLIKLPR